MDTASVRPPSRMLLALVGGVVLGIIIPAILITMNVVWSSRAAHSAGLLSFLSYGFFICGPGLLILSGLIMAAVRNVPKERVPDHRFWIKEGSMLGAFLGLLNFPAYTAIFFLELGWMNWVRLLILVSLSGVVSGAWVGWQAYREVDPKAAFWPQYTLRELMICVLIWGLMLAFFSQ